MRTAVLVRPSPAVRRPSVALAGVIATLCLGAACSSSGDPNGTGGTSGARASGGAGGGATGGSAAGGSGPAGTGGAAATGGAPAATGGAGGAGTGGAPAGTGGAATGGAGGSTDAGDGGSAEAGADAATDARVDGLAPGGPFTLTSSAFMPGGIIMRRYRCKFDDVSPPLSWTPGPVGTKSYAVTMRSAGSPHWALWDIPADVTSLPEKIERLAMPPLPAGSKQCKPNVDGSTWYGYAGACPMGGNNLRSYFFNVYALKVERLPGVTPDSSIREVNAAIMANQIGSAMLVGMASPSTP